MRVVLDTNILVSALIAPAGNPAAIYNAWEQGKFTLLTCTEHVLNGLFKIVRNTDPGRLKLQNSFHDLAPLDK